MSAGALKGLWFNGTGPDEKMPTVSCWIIEHVSMGWYKVVYFVTSADALLFKAKTALPAGITPLGLPGYLSPREHLEEYEHSYQIHHLEDLGDRVLFRTPEEGMSESEISEARKDSAEIEEYLSGK